MPYKGGTGGGGGGSQKKKKKPFIIPEWKMTKKGETIEHERATLHWCKHHIHTEELWDGLYMSHKPEDHESWKE